MPDGNAGTPTTTTQPLDLTPEQALIIAVQLNADNHLDAYGAVWTQASVSGAHAGADANQRKRLLYLLYLYLQAIG